MGMTNMHVRQPCRQQANKSGHMNTTRRTTFTLAEEEDLDGSVLLERCALELELLIDFVTYLAGLGLDAQANVLLLRRFVWRGREEASKGVLIGGALVCSHCRRVVWRGGAWVLGRVCGWREDRRRRERLALARVAGFRRSAGRVLPRKALESALAPTRWRQVRRKSREG